MYSSGETSRYKASEGKRQIIEFVERKVDRKRHIVLKVDSGHFSSSLELDGFEDKKNSVRH